MRLLLFLIIGTLIFGFAFPAFIFIVAFFLLIFVVLALFSFFTGALGGKHVIIYKNGKRVDPFGERAGSAHTADNPEVIGKAGYGGSGGANDFGEDAEPEVVELPASALRKESEEEDGE